MAFVPTAAAEAPVEETRRIEVVGEPDARVFEDSALEVQIVSEAELRAAPATNAADVVEHLIGIRTQGRVQGEEQVVSIEGLPPEYTRVLVNGQRYAGQIGEVDDLRDICLENLERVEVKRGTQGIRYGSEVAGGVIDLVSKRPPKNGTRAHIQSGLGDAGAVIGSGTLAWGRERFGTALSYCHDQIDGFDSDEGVATSGGTDGGQRKSDDAYGSTVWNPAPGLEWTTRYGYRTERDEFDASGDSRTDNDRYLANSELGWEVGEATRTLGRFAYYRGITDSTNARSFRFDEHEWKGEAELEHYLETGALGHVLTLGAVYQRPALDLEERGFPSLIDVSDPRVDFQVEGVREEFDVGAVFLESETELTSWATVLLGVRGQFHSQFADRVLPQAALRLKPHETLALRFEWGQHYRPPTLKDLFQPPVQNFEDAGYLLQGNPDLKPESSERYRV
ncbi:MAG: TonB-dependent receptor, partial [Proteobacteria bacterium]|nr:TonB-dependent receptor [Pseudomonadota bacterium]